MYVLAEGVLNVMLFLAVEMWKPCNVTPASGYRSGGLSCICGFLFLFKEGGIRDVHCLMLVFPRVTGHLGESVTLTCRWIK